MPSAEVSSQNYPCIYTYEGECMTQLSNILLDDLVLHWSPVSCCSNEELQCTMFAKERSVMHSGPAFQVSLCVYMYNHRDHFWLICYFTCSLFALKLSSISIVERDSARAAYMSGVQPLVSSSLMSALGPYC